MAELLPIAFTIDWLVPATINATALQSFLLPLRGEMTGGGREREMSVIEFLAAFGYVLSCSFAGVIGAFAIPLAMASQGGDPMDWISPSPPKPLLLDERNCGFHHPES